MMIEIRHIIQKIQIALRFFEKFFKMSSVANFLLFKGDLLFDKFKP